MKRILISYEYFLPAFKAGGPVQSIANMARQLCDSYDLYIVCSNSDAGESSSLPEIVSDTWTDFENGVAQVYYISQEEKKFGTIRKIVREIKPDYIFANGIYSFLFSLAPILVRSKAKKIMSVRGMLHPGALSVKSLKKNIFLSIFKALGIQNKVTFHVTDEKEAGYVRNVFGEKVGIAIAENFPKQIKASAQAYKNANELKLVSIALISPMKNHLLAIEALKNVPSKVVYDIYGPVKDANYWEECKKEITKLSANIIVNYMGDLQPEKLVSTLAQYNVFILPSKSENFGHAIYEALACGVPVITSYFTPWNNLEEQKAGLNVDISDINDMTKAIDKLALVDNETFMKWSEGASQLAQKAVSFEGTKLKYFRLFL
ncbi:MAG: glycosyltransferase [Flavipsychrobacter sp.]|nr:glycosyltransferase [Flavipsychrobacter sp.]